MNESVLSYLSGNLRTHCQTGRDCLIKECPFLPFFGRKPCKYVTKTLWQNYILEGDPILALAITAKNDMDDGKTTLANGLGLYKMEAGMSLEKLISEIEKER